MKLKPLFFVLCFVVVCWQARAQYSLPACSPAWNPSTTYAVGDRVSYQFSNTQGQQMISVERPGSSISVQSLTPGLHFSVTERIDRSIRKQKVMKE